MTVIMSHPVKTVLYASKKFLHVFRTVEAAALFVDNHGSEYHEQNDSPQYVALALLTRHP